MIKYKKTISTCLSIVMLFVLLSVPAYADDNKKVTGNNTGVSNVYIQPTKQDLEQIEKEKKIKEKELSEKIKNPSNILTLTVSMYYDLPVTCYHQDTYYWCGPASLKQTLSFHKAKSGSQTELPSQSTLASQAGTTLDGSLTLNLKNTLNSYSGTFGTFTYTCDKIDDSFSLNQFITVVRTETQYQMNAPIFYAKTDYIPRYGTFECFHYITIGGYEKYDDGISYLEKMKTVDCNWDWNYCGTFWDDVGSTTVKGVYCAAYQMGLITGQAYTFIY